MTKSTEFGRSGRGLSGRLQTDFCVESINKSAGDIPGTAAAIIEHLNLNVPTSDIGYTKQTNMVNTLL